MIKNIEQKYIKLTHKEHVLQRPETYVGSIINENKDIFIIDNINNIDDPKITIDNVNYNPGFIKIFDEILTNASDHAIRTNMVKYIKVNIHDDHITIENNGPGIPIDIHKKEKVHVPELLFGHLLTGENYDDTENRITGGRNGYGAKLTNIFSKTFEIETADGKKVYSQKFVKNLSRTYRPKIRSSKRNYTKVTYYPDFNKFNMDGTIDYDTRRIFLKRTIDIAAYNPKVKVYFNGKLIPIKSFKDYINMFVDDKNFIYEKINDNWEIGISVNNDESFIQSSMVNGISTINGGTHVNYITNVISNIIKDYIIKNNKGLRIRTNDIKNHLFMFVNCKIVNPTFENQTKETLTTKISQDVLKDFDISDSFIRRLTRSNIVSTITDRILLRNQYQLQKDINKKSKSLKIKKLDDATMAGTRESNKCYLFLTEGDSALSTCLSGFSVTGRKYFGAFPLKGKPLNVRGEGLVKIKNNEEIKNIISAIGLEFGKKYSSTNGLRYGKVVIMTDADSDGNHIKGLIINMFSTFWPELLDMDFVYEFITPIVRINKGKIERYFYHLNDYKRWKKTVNTSNWSITYFKGLGTIQPKEAKIFFRDIDKYLIKFNTESSDVRDNMIDLVFNKKRTDDRKGWLLSYEPGKEIDKFKYDQTYEKFIDNELIEFGMDDNIRSIPNIMDGLKPGQRKILYTLFKKNYKNQIKVSSLAGSVTETTSYHHGQISLENTIVSMAQNFIGSNNINLIEPKGQFGTRLKGGKDASASRYIFTELSPVTRKIFMKDDDELLDYLDDDGFKIEPRFYVPIIPMILINGSDGIGTGWRSDIPSYDTTDVINYLVKKIKGTKRNIKISPKFNGFRGDIVFDKDNNRYLSKGVFTKVNSTTISITELPIGVWNDKYYDFLDKLTDEGIIKGYIKNCTDKDINITVYVSRINMKQLMDGDTHKILGLVSYMNLNNMYLFDIDYKLKKFDSPYDIIDYFYNVRLSFYEKRKASLIDKMKSESTILRNRIKFINGVITNKIKIHRQPKEKIEASLEVLKIAKMDNNYDYLLSMPIYSFTKEKITNLKQRYDDLKNDIDVLRKTDIKEMWLYDLKSLKQSIK